MKIKSGFMTRQIGDKIVGIAVGERSLEFNGMINLNETGQFIWKCLESDTDINEVTDKVVKEYNIDKDTASKAVCAFIDELKKYNFIED